MSHSSRANKKRTTEVSDDVSRRLIEAIVSWQLSPGQPIREARLAKEWNVSRTPVREAVRRASALGLVDLRPNQTPLVRSLTSDDVGKLYRVREVLELLALELSFERIPIENIEDLSKRAATLEPASMRGSWRPRALALDTDLHQLWISNCDNRWLQAAFNQNWMFIKILQQFVARDETALRNAFAEHSAILKALRAGEFAATNTALKHHIRSSSEYLNRLLTSKAYPFPVHSQNGK